MLIIGRKATETFLLKYLLSVGMHRILFLPDIRLIQKPGTGYPVRAGHLYSYFSVCNFLVRTTLASVEEANDSNGPGSKNIPYMLLNGPTLPLKKYINLKWLPKQKFSCMPCHWYRMHDFCVRKSIISRRIRSRVQKGFSPWIRGPGGIVWWKTKGRKSRDTVSLNWQLYV
jgi:hypothetical protein